MITTMLRPPSEAQPWRSTRTCGRGLIAVAVVLLLAGCQSVPTAENQSHRPLSHEVQIARSAWTTLGSTPPESPAAAKAMQRYNRAVEKVVEGLAQYRGAGWARPVALGSSGTLRFDDRGKGLLSLADFDRMERASETPLKGVNQRRDPSGLGVPVVLIQDDPEKVSHRFHAPRGEFLPGTVVIDFSSGSDAVVRIHDPLKTTEVRVGDRVVTLAEDPAAALQYSLTNETEDQNGNPNVANSASGEDESQLYLLGRYDPTKTPVVFVHGLRSGPTIWKNAVNDLISDPDLRAKYQPLCFVYPSNLPIPASAARLRQLLSHARKTLDPGHHNPGFDRLVLVGHSMGGLVCRMQVTDSGSDYWDAFFSVPPEKLVGAIDPKTMSMVRRSMFFKRQKNVAAVIFICTPHQGSVLATNKLIQGLVDLVLFLPKTARDRMRALQEIPESYVHPALRSFNDWGVNGIETLSPEHPFFKALLRRPVPVPHYSIISTRDPKNYQQSDDGVVPYWSSHLDTARSETILDFAHGCVEQQATVDAIEKILTKL